MQSKFNNWIVPDWPASTRVNAVCTTRHGGVSTGNYSSMNLGIYVEDKPEHVEQNRAILKQKLRLEHEPLWLKQIHSNKVLNSSEVVKDRSKADATISFEKDLPCVVLTADCLPVLFTNKQGSAVAAAHAGWRGLHRGVLENTVVAFNTEPENILAWLGPAIGPQSFEVRDEVREAFITDYAKTATAFTPKANDKWLADIYTLARVRLARTGVDNIYGGGFDTMTDNRFFSYRRVRKSGRMASLIWFS